METFKCGVCGLEKETQTSGGTGYGTKEDGTKVCYACCAVEDAAQMKRDGRTVLYLTYESETYETARGRRKRILPGTAKVTNWPGSVVIKCNSISTGSHNFAGTRYDVWFTDGDGAQWHGTQYGEYTQLCHCKRLKS